MLMAPYRRGFTLIEIMLSMVMMLLVSGTIYQLLFTTQRLSRTQAERLALQAGVRGAALVVGNELRELSTVEAGNSTQNDILSLGPNAVSYRAMRGFGYTCQALAAGVLRIDRTGFSGYRDPQAGRDSALVYVPGLTAPADSGWTPLAITNVSSAAACAGAAGPGLTLTTAGSIPVGTAPAGTPVRIYEPMELGSYRSEGQFWLGMRSLSSGEAIQPVFGPLDETQGFRLDYADATGGATLIATAVKSITIALRGVSPAFEAFPGEPLAEAVTTQIMLRNGAY
jgi:prepilin-type N-terminal cleavage/methylation domain-containing protein